MQSKMAPTFKNINVPPTSNRSISIHSVVNQSALNQSNISSLPDYSMNQSMTSEAAMMKL